MTKTIPKTKKFQKVKWLYEEALQIAEKEDKLKTKIYFYFNAEFQRIARGDKKAFLSDQCK